MSKQRPGFSRLPKVKPADRLRRRYEAADRQGWRCAICGHRMKDYRSDPMNANDGFGPFATTLLSSDGEIRAGHFSCVNAYHARCQQETLL